MAIVDRGNHQLHMIVETSSISTYGGLEVISQVGLEAQRIIKTDFRITLIMRLWHHNAAYCPVLMTGPRDWHSSSKENVQMSQLNLILSLKHAASRQHLV